MNKNKLSANDWQMAEFASTACNLSGLVHSLAELMPKIRAAVGGGTEEANRHPLVRCFLYQMMWLAFRTQVTDEQDLQYMEALDFCKRSAAEIEERAEQQVCSECGIGIPTEEQMLVCEDCFKKQSEEEE